MLELIIAVILSSVPIMLAATGELVVERSGVLNLGVEGMMLMGAVIASITVITTGSLFLAVIFGALSGLLTSIVFGFCSSISNQPSCNWFGFNYFWNRIIWPYRSRIRGKSHPKIRGT